VKAVSEKTQVRFTMYKQQNSTVTKCRVTINHCHSVAVSGWGSGAQPLA